MDLFIEWIEKHIAIISGIIISLVVAVIGLFGVRMMRKHEATKTINKKILNSFNDSHQENVGDNSFVI